MSEPFFLILDNLEGLAGSALMRQRATQAARLFGQAQALRTAKRMLPSAPRRVHQERDLAEARAMLGASAFREAMLAGETMRLDEAITLALEASSDPGSARAQEG